MQCEHAIVGLSLSRSNPNICLVSLQDAPPQILDLKANKAESLPNPQIGKAVSLAMPNAVIEFLCVLFAILPSASYPIQPALPRHHDSSTDSADL